MTVRGSALLVCSSQSVSDDYALSLRDEGFEVDRAERFEAAVESFARRRPDVLLLQVDPRSPLDIEKIEFITELAPTMPLVLAVGTDERLTRIEVHSAGDVHQLEGPFKPSRLIAKVVALSAVKAVVEKLKRENERLQVEANIDQLTGVYNRRFLFERIKHELARSSRFAESFALLMLDLDNFKRFNDEFGHETGDGVLIKVASFLADRVRQVDTVARYGGDEFVILLAQASRGAAELVAERLRSGVEHLELEAAGTKSNVSLTASVGCYGYPGSGGRDLNTLISCADRALYAAKHAGGNRVEVFDAPN